MSKPMTLRQQLACLIAEQPGIGSPTLAQYFEGMLSHKRAVAAMLSRMHAEGQVKREPDLAWTGPKKGRRGGGQRPYAYWPADKKDEPMTWNTYERSMLREFPRGTEVKGAHGGGIEITVPCRDGHTVTESMKMHFPPDKARKVFTNKGWLLEANRAYCPEHVKKKDEPVTQQPVLHAIANKPAPAVQPATVASEEAKVAKRMAIMLLEDKFDTKGGRFKDGYSDLKVAKEVGLAESHVATIREEFFGPIREPAEIGELRTKLAQLQEQADSYGREFEATIKVSREKLDALREEASSCGRKLAALVARNGW